MLFMAKSNAFGNVSEMISIIGNTLHEIRSSGNAPGSISNIRIHAFRIKDLTSFGSRAILKIMFDGASHMSYFFSMFPGWFLE